MQPQLLPLQQTGEDMDEVAIEEVSVCLRCQKGQKEMVEESQLPVESSGYEMGEEIGIGMRMSHHHHVRSS